MFLQKLKNLFNKKNYFYRVDVSLLNTHNPIVKLIQGETNSGDILLIYPNGKRCEVPCHRINSGTINGIYTSLELAQEALERYRASQN